MGMKIVKTIFTIVVLVSGIFAIGQIGKEEYLSRIDPAAVEETDHSVNRIEYGVGTYIWSEATMYVNVCGQEYSCFADMDAREDGKKFLLLCGFHNDELVDFIITETAASGLTH